MAGRQGFITNHLTYVYQNAPDNSSAAFGVDTNDSDKWKLCVKLDDSAYLFSVSHFTIDPATDGNITLRPNGTGSLVLTSLATGSDVGVVLHSAAGLLSSSDHGTAGQVLTSNGTGSLPTWQASGGGGIGTLNGDSGSATGATVTLTGAGGITTSASGATVTITGSTGITWARKTTTPITMVASNGYVQANAGAGLTTFVMPATAALGTEIQVIGESSGGWTITHAVGTNQYIQFGNLKTTTTSGSLSSSNRYDCVTLVCSLADTVWSVTSSTGVLNVA